MHRLSLRFATALVPSMALAGCSLSHGSPSTTSTGAQRSTHDPPGSAPVDTAPASPIASRTPLWSIASGARSAALTRDGALAAVDASGADLLRIEADGTLASSQALPEFAAELQALARLDVPLGALDGIAIANGEVAVVDATHTYVVARDDCSEPIAWDVAVGGTAVRFGPSGDVYVAGVDAALERTLTKLAAADGSVVWTVKLDDATTPFLQIRAAALPAIAVDAAGAVYVAGYVNEIDTRSGGSSQWLGVVAKITADGDVAWRADRFGDTSRAIAVDATGAVTVAGRTRSDGPVDDLDVERYLPDGSLAWAFLPSHADEVATRLTADPYLAVDAAGNAFVAASVDEGGLGAMPVLVLALDASGQAAWHAYATGSASGIAVDASDRVYVARTDGIDAYAGP